jgi:hypothetical protein
MRIHRTRRLNQHQNRRIHRQRTSQSNSLTLTTRQRPPTLSNPTIQPTHNRRDNITSISHIQGAEKSRIGRVRPGGFGHRLLELAAEGQHVRDLVPDGPRLERAGVRPHEVGSQAAHVQLRDRAGEEDVGPDLGDGVGPQVDVVGVGGVGVVDARYARGDAGRLGGGRRDEGGEPAGLDAHSRGCVGQGRGGPIPAGQGGVDGRVAHQVVGAEDPGELLDAHPGAGAVVDGLRQGAQGHFEVGGEAVEGDELADGHSARVGHPQPSADDRSGEQCRAGVLDRVEGGPEPRRPDARLLHFEGLGAVSLVVDVLAAHAAHHSQPGHSVGGQGREDPLFFALFGQAFLERSDDPGDEGHDQGHPHRDEQTQRRRRAEHERGDDHEGDGRSDGLGDEGDEGAEPVGVLCDRGDDVTRGHVPSDVGAPPEDNPGEPTGRAPCAAHPQHDGTEVGHAHQAQVEDQPRVPQDSRQDGAGEAGLDARIEHAPHGPRQ